MLIQALCDYYDILAAAGKVLPDGYSNVKIHYLICLNEEGKITDLLQYQNKEEIVTAKGKIREKWVPKNAVMPERTEKPGIESNIVEHRPLYIFGLNLENGRLTPEDRTDKARKSHEIFVRTNLAFLEGLDSPVINAFRNFLLTWNPQEETGNMHLLNLGKEYANSGFAFCLTGYPDQLLHEDVQIRQSWERSIQKSSSEAAQGRIAQCAVSGEISDIARIHNKIRGVPGGLATGSVLISFKNTSENSYGNEQSYNSNISQIVMKKYTEALNYLLESTTHRAVLDDITIVFWAMDANETSEDLLRAMLYGQSDQMNAEKTEYMLKSILEDARKGKITQGRLASLETIQTDVDFYILGLKPNSSRLSVKFIYRKKFADILWNIARFQQDLQTSKDLHPVSIARIKAELLSPKSSSDKMNPALFTKLLEAILYGGPYPVSLLETAVRRVKTDGDQNVNAVRTGLIKACMNRNYIEEEFHVSLDNNNHGQAYLCGRLFAVLERVQQAASKNSLNRTIKDAYFASASSKPGIVFPKLLKLAQNHLNKLDNPVFYNKLIGEIMDQIDGEFPETLLLQDQGRFIIGYYQQTQRFFEKKETVQNKETEENENGN